MNRRAALLSGSALAMAVLLGALAWIARTALALERGQAEARARAALEERVRLALWRMDSSLAAFLAQENARPAGGALPGGDPMRPYLRLRFEIDSTGRLAVAGGPASDADRRLLARDPLLAALAQAPLAAPRPESPLQAVAAARATPTTRKPEETRHEKDEASPQLEAEIANQAMINSAEFSQRQQIAAPPLVPIGSPPLSPVSSASAAPIPPISPSARSRPADRTARIKTPLQPVWREGELLLARRIERGGGEALEGIWLDREAVRAWLLGPTRDLLPAADLRPAPNGEKVDPGRQLALLPLRLDPGPQPAPEGLGGSPARLGLALATAAILAVALAAGLLIAAALRLARRRDVFVSAVTHELRTPLTTFRLYTEMLDEGLVAADRRGEYVATLRAQADRLGHLVENVLAFARLERRGAAVAAEAIPLGSLLQPIAERLSEDLGRRGLAVSLDLPPALASERARADPIAVERILQNLADNAAKYAAAGESPRFDLAVTLERRNALLTARDGGPGIPRAERSRLFRPFHKSAAQAATAGAPGLGLGLALSRALARSFGGDLRYVEREGDGAGFELALPRA